MSAVVNERGAKMFVHYSPGQGNEYYITKSYTGIVRLSVRKLENCNLKFSRRRGG